MLRKATIGSGFRKKCFYVIFVISLLFNFLLYNLDMKTGKTDQNDRNKLSNTKLGGLRGSNNYDNSLCALDWGRLETLKNIYFEDDPPEKIKQQFHKFVTNPFNSVCKEQKRFGGSYKAGCSHYDGQKIVCMDDILQDLENNECLIYSFGIKDDWSFEDTMDKIGCTVYAYDPTVDFPRNRGHQITFEKIGLTARRYIINNLYSMSDILRRNNHSNKKISFLKMDIGGHELSGLPAWYESGAFKNVQQIGFKFHLKDTKETVFFFKNIWDLTFKEKFRLFSYDLDRNYAGCQEGIKMDVNLNYAEIVLKRLDEEHMCSNFSIINRGKP